MLALTYLDTTANFLPRAEGERKHLQKIIGCFRIDEGVERKGTPGKKTRVNVSWSGEQVVEVNLLRHW